MSHPNESGEEKGRRSDRQAVTASVSESENPAIPSPRPKGLGPGPTRIGGRISRTSRFSTSTRRCPIRWAKASTTRKSSRPSTWRRSSGI